MSLNIGVFGSSSNKTPELFKEACRELGELLVDRGHVCVNGGGTFGCMGAVNEGVVGKNGKSIGVIHKIWVVDIDEKQEGMTAMVIADGPNLVERKRLLFEHSDCYIIMPGGPGTFDEMWEVISDFQIGFSKKPVCIVNVGGYYDGTLQQLKRAERDSILHKPANSIVKFCNTPLEAIEFCEKAAAAAAASSSNGKDDDQPSVLRKRSELPRSANGSSFNFLRESFGAGFAFGIVITVIAMKAFGGGSGARQALTKTRCTYGVKNHNPTHIKREIKKTKSYLSD